MSGIRVEKVGPWGGSGGGAFEAISRLTRIRIHHRNAIRALEFQHEINGVLQWSSLLGNNKESQMSEIVLQQGEYLSSISGHTGTSEGFYVVTSLTLISNFRKYGPFGREVGSAFGLPRAGNTKIVGFYGSTGGLLDSIGVYLETCLDFAKEREELSKKLAQVTAENNALKDEAKNRTKEREGLVKTVNQLTTENSTLKIEVQKHTMEREGLVKTVNQLTAENSTLKNEAQKHTMVREDLEKKVAKLIEENDSLKAKLEKTKSQRILSKMDESYSLAAQQDGGVGFVQSNSVDKYQHWNKYLRDDSNLRDSEGFPCFAIVNQATLEAIQYRGPVRPVGLVPYDPNTVDASILWTEGKDTGEGFHYVRSVNNINYIWDAFNANTKLHEGIKLGIYNMPTGRNQLWKIQPWA